MSLLNYGIINSIISWDGSGDKLVNCFIFVGLAILVLGISYLLGSLSSAIIISKTMFNEDVRSHGSGNAGLTNMLRTYGKGAAALTLIGDMLKTAVAILVTAVVFGFNYNNGICLSGMCYLSGLCAVLGHVFPIFYGFKGGKGVLVTATMALMLTPVIFISLLIVFITTLVITGFVSLGSIIVAALFPVTVCLYSHLIGGALPVLTAICSVFLGLFVIWCHRTNIKRLKDGNEKRISIGKRK